MNDNTNSHMPPSTRSRRFWQLSCLTMLALFMDRATQPQIAAQESGPRVIWSEDFEDPDTFWEDWHTDGPFWEVGSAEGIEYLAPNTSFVAGTVISEKVTIDQPTRLIRHAPLTIPGTDQNPRLRVSEWRGAPDVDSTSIHEIEITIGDPRYNFDYVQDLELPENTTVQIVSPDHAHGNLDSDSIRLITGNFHPGVRIEFRTDLDHDESFAAADYRTIMFNNGFTTNSRIALKTTDATYSYLLPDRNASLSTYTYPISFNNSPLGLEFKISGNPDTPIFSLQIKGTTIPTATTVGLLTREQGEEWKPLNPARSGSSPQWTPSEFDLSHLAGKQIELGFELRELNNGYGWHIDDLALLAGPYETAFPQDFEQDYQGWSVPDGQWHISKDQIGENGPRNSSAFARISYDETSDNTTLFRLVSPPYVIPSAVEKPRLRFWHWFNFAANESGKIQVRRSGESWNSIEEHGSSISGIWSPRSIDLSALANKKVQFAFAYQSTTSLALGRERGWLVDDINIETGTNPLSFPEDFESGLDHWHVTNGIWEVGEPSPTNHRKLGGSSLGTIIDRNYPDGANSSAVSPPFTVPPAREQPRLRCWTRHQFGTGDTGSIWFFPEAGSAGDQRQPMLLGDQPFTGQSLEWTQPSLSLESVAGLTGRLHFLLIADGSGTGFGWFIDNIDIETGAQEIRNPEGFESGLGDWTVVGGNWADGEPSSGPSEARSGKAVVGTVLQGDYPANANATLISPKFRIPTESSVPAVRFWHWYELADGDTITVDLIDEAGNRSSIATPTSNSSLGRWINGFAPLSPFIGQTVQLAFHLRSDAESQGPGWFLDDIRLQSNILDRLDDLTLTEGEIATFLLERPADGLELTLELVETHWITPSPTDTESTPTADGATLQSQLGVFNWPTDESHGPATFTFRVGLFDPQSSWNPIDFRDFDITVMERQAAPRFPIGNTTLLFNEGDTVRATIAAEDPDLPQQALTYSLDSAPQGAAINPSNGLFLWIPSAEQANQTHTIIVRATDSGDPPLSATTIVTAIPESLTGPAPITSRVIDGNLVIEFEHIETNTPYRLLESDNIRSSLSDWERLQEFTWASTPFMVEIPLAGSSSKFYALVKER